MKISLCLFIAILLLSSGFAPAQTPTIEFQKSLGGSLNEDGWSALQTNDGGFIIAGEAVSGDGDLSFHYGTTFGNDAWIIKLDGSGNLQWQKSLGGSSDDGILSIIQTTDGKYVAAGFTASEDFDITFNHGGYDCWVIKLDESGNVIWQKTFGGNKDEFGNAIKQTSDGGYIIAASASSSGGDVSGHHGLGANADYWIVKLDPNGNLIWQKCLGGSKDDYAFSILEAPGDGYIAAGHARSSNGDITVSYGLSDMWIVKLDLLGNLLWQTSVGGSNEDGAHSIATLPGGGYIVCGNSLSTDNGISNYGNYDVLAVKLNASGTIQWKKNFGGSQLEDAYGVSSTADGGFTIGGYTQSNNFDVGENNGDYDFWVVHVGENGVLKWEETYGGSETETLQSLATSADGGFVLCGTSESNNKDVSGNHGLNDIWFVKLTPVDASHSITVTSLSSTELCQGEDVAIAFAATGIFNPGNIFTAQLSNDIGIFASPLDIGSIASTSSGVINAIIPPVGPGEGYRIRVLSSDPEITSEAYGTNISISCPTPASLITGTITQSSSRLKWTNVGCGVGYQVRYRIKGTSTWTKTFVASSSIVLQNLLPATEYNWSVRTKCTTDPNLYSGWALNETFTTQPLKLGDPQPLSELLIYPNPVKDILHIATGNFSVNEIRMTNFLGEIIYQQPATSSPIQLDISNLPSGIYLIYLNSGGVVITRQFIKE